MARLLFVTRKYPPAIGGMETLSRDVHRCLEAAGCRPLLLALGRSQRHLAWWLPFAVLRTAWLVATRRVSHVLAGDALTFTALRMLPWRHSTRASVIVCGLDLTWRPALYQWLVRRALPTADRVLPISAATARAAAERGAARPRIVVVRPGVDAPVVTPAHRAAARARVCAQLQAEEGVVLLLTLGRLVPRKGVRWFVTEVLPRLDSRASYVVAGDGPERGAIAAAAAAAGVADRVRLLGRVDDALREDLLAGCDLFLQPNVHVAGDMEGFGLVTIEAALRGTPVIAAALEGIRDAVINGETGILVPAGDAQAFVDRLVPLIADDAARREAGHAFECAARHHFSTERMRADLSRALDMPEAS